LGKRIDHIAIAVQSLTEALEVYSGLLGLPVSVVEEIVEQKTRVALLPIGESRIELLEPTADDSPVARFLARRGEGIHHICFRVEDLAEELERLKSAGMRLIDEHPMIGAGGCRIAFLHPSAANGVLIELSQPVGNNPHETSE
jgi:methylmalonyl-CoA/ethylmalonyl-CoA epimerase